MVKQRNKRASLKIREDFFLLHEPGANLQGHRFRTKSFLTSNSSSITLYPTAFSNQLEEIEKLEIKIQSRGASTSEADQADEEPKLTIDTVTKSQWKALSDKERNRLICEGIDAYYRIGGDPDSSEYLGHLFRHEIEDPFDDGNMVSDDEALIDPFTDPRYEISDGNGSTHDTHLEDKTTTPRLKIAPKPPPRKATRNPLSRKKAPKSPPRKVPMSPSGTLNPDYVQDWA
jgi:hypothetical protein